MIGHVARLIAMVVCVASVSAARADETLVVWHTETDPNTIAALERIAANFEQQNSGVDVEYLQVGWDDLYTKLALAIRSGTFPDLTHIEPFMAAYLYKQDLLLALDDIIEVIGVEEIYPVVRDLQLFDGKRYGIASALGISFYVARADYYGRRIEDYDPTWNGFTELITQGENSDPRAPVLLPANDLHMTLLFTEMLASNGGSLFDREGQPAFEDPRVLEVLEYWKLLYSLIPAHLQSASYAENFSHFARGESSSLPGFFGRGILQIEREAPAAVANPEVFQRIDHPVGPSGTTAYATLDAEPWVIFRGASHPGLAKQFLRFFYERENYLDYTLSVPVHLTPIFVELAEGAYRENTHVKEWRPFYDYQLEMLRQGRVLPIFMSRPSDRLVPALFRLEGSGVVPEMIRAVVRDGLSPADAASRAMNHAQDLGAVSSQEPDVGTREKDGRFGLLIFILGAAAAVAGLVALIWALRNRN